VVDNFSEACHVPVAHPQLAKILDDDMDEFQEDIEIVESVQRGLASQGYDQGRYVCDPGESWFSETLLHGFHMQVLEALEQS
jgi:phenylpropionate dioxygenase-like ring-hydroxylating dioxygenase large terminal subunit